MAQQPFAVFDIDGTLIRWQLYHAIADELGRRGQLDAKLYEAAKIARRTWKQRAPHGSFDAYEIALVRAYDEAVTRLPVAEVYAAMNAVFNEYQDQVYTYTRDLILMLKRQNYLVFALSGSQHDIVEQLAQYYGFDDSFGTFYPEKDGTYTGDKQLVRSATKPEYLRTLVEQHNATWEGSYAVGDSESDIPMLTTVEHPIAFNPTQKLLKHAQKQQWDIVVERKNSIYRLVAHNGIYELET